MAQSFDMREPRKRRGNSVYNSLIQKEQDANRVRSAGLERYPGVQSGYKRKVNTIGGGYYKRIVKSDGTIIHRSMDLEGTPQEDKVVGRVAGVPRGYGQAPKRRKPRKPYSGGGQTIYE